jgi:hypothetical protein
LKSRIALKYNYDSLNRRPKMRIQFLIIFLIYTMFTQKSWAPPPGQGGATGVAETPSDISKCDLNQSKQTKVKVKDKDGKEHFICTGQAVCGGKPLLFHARFLRGSHAP